MIDLNPYQSPTIGCTDDSLSTLCCPHCQLTITFWCALKQRSPFRFKCPRCKTECSVHTPQMRLILVGVIWSVLLSTIVLGWAAMKYGWVVLLPAIPLSIVAFVALEIWTHQYIKRNGRFLIVKIGARSETHETSSLDRN